MLGLGLGADRGAFYYGKAQYLGDSPAFVQGAYSLAFNAEGAETLNDYEANTLYFRDSSFNRVAATFSRTSSATRVNKQGLIESVATGVPRIDYSDGSAKLLLEPSRTNALSYSEDFSQFYLNRATKTNLGAFSLRSSADLTLFNQSSTSSYYAAVRNLTSGTTHTFSQFVDTSLGGKVTGVASNSGKNYSVDILDGTVYLNNFASASHNIVNITSTIYKVSITITSEASENHFFWLPSTTGTTGNDGNSIAATCFQLEAGSYPTSYIPTAGSAVTRNGDLINYTLSNTIATPNGGTVFYDVAPSALSLANTSASLGFGMNAGYIRLGGNNGSTWRLRIEDPGTIFNGSSGIVRLNGGSVAVKYNNTTHKAFAGGLQILDSGTPANYTSINTISAIPSEQQGIYPIRQIIAFNTALTDSECIQLTS